MKRVAILAISAVFLSTTGFLLADFSTTDFTASVKETYSPGGTPRGIAVADFNGDGHLDFVTGSAPSYPDDVAVFFGKGDGTFTLHSHLNVPFGPFGVTTGDLDHDGHPDILITSADSNEFTIIRWDPESGDFDSPKPGSTVATDPREIVTADFNRDGQLDFAAAYYGCGCVEVWLNEGGAFPTHFRQATGPGAHGLAVADFNKDGIPDLVVTNAAQNTVSILWGDGRGAFGFTSTLAVGAGPRNVTVGDFNEDGIPDFATVNTAGNSVTLGFGVRVAPGTESNFFNLRTLNTGSTLSSPRDIETADVNGDGKIDLIIPNFNSGQVVFLLGDGQGHFGAAEGVKTDSSRAGDGARTVAVGDVNEDGRIDVLVGNQNGASVSVFLNGTPFRGRP